MGPCLLWIQRRVRYFPCQAVIVLEKVSLTEQYRLADNQGHLLSQ